MGVEAGQHAVDRALDEALVVDLVDIFGLHPLEHGHELVELLVGIDIGGGAHRAGRRDQGHGGGEDGAVDQGLAHAGTRQGVKGLM